MWAAVEQARAVADIAVGYVRPLDGFTTEEYAGQYGLARATARDQIAKMFRDGTLQRSAVMLPLNTGGLRRTWVYTPKVNA
jgi:hypothetical protein